MQEKKPFNKTEYDNQYKKENYKTVRVLIPKKDAELLEYINSHKPLSSYFLELARQDMKKNK